MNADAPTARARIGTSAWNKDSWKGRFHPIELPPQRSLRYTAERLRTIEVNTTFHARQPPERFRGWHAGTPSGFMFSIKGDQTVTHAFRLQDPRRHLADFFASGVLLLREKLGPILWQIQDTQPYRPEVVEAFLAALPHTGSEARRLIEEHSEADADAVVPDGEDRRLRHAFEVRHPSFQTPAFAEQLRRYDVAGVLANAPGRPAVTPFTSDFVYARLHGGAGFHPEGYDDEELSGWAERITGWTDGFGCADARARDVFVYFDNRETEGWHPPFDAVRLQRLIDGDTSEGPEVSVPTPLW